MFIECFILYCGKSTEDDDDDEDCIELMYSMSLEGADIIDFLSFIMLFFLVKFHTIYI